MRPPQYRTEVKERGQRYARMRWSWDKRDAARTLESWQAIRDVVHLRQVRRDRDGRERELWTLR